MHGLAAISAIVLLNLRSLPRRLAPSLVTVVGVAGVVLVFATVLSIARGFERTLASAGSDETAIVLRGGATSEMSSGLSHEQVLIVSNAPGIRKADGQPLVSAELFVVADVEMRDSGGDANVPFRGVQPAALEVRENVTLVEGRMFEPGRNEMIVGRAAQQEFVGLGIGDTITFGQTSWQVVGAFEAGGSASESELWTDVRVLQEAYRRGNSYQSVHVKLESPESLETLRTFLEEDPRIDASVESERTFYSSQSRFLATFIKWVGYPLTVLMAVGAVCGALNSMYSSVSARGREIATLRALGFGPFAVLVSTMFEAVVLALAGGVIGALLAYLVFNGFQVSTLSLSSFSQVVFDFAVTPDLLVQGILAALIIGLVGGFFPALRAARLPVAKALREL